MSLHAHLSPEAVARLRAQKRNSTISSIIISALVLVLVGFILALILLPSFLVESPVIVAYSSDLDKETEIESKKITHQVKKEPSAPASAIAKVIASSTPSPTAIPVPDVVVSNPSVEFGNSDDFGSGWGGGGDGGGGGFGKIPASMRKRCSRADRLARLAANGGNVQCEDAVMASLRWLKATQNPDGSWSKSDQAAMTGFAVLAFLGHCETPLSAEFGDAVLGGITCLVNVGMKSSGKITVHAPGSNHWVYEHGIGTYALAESYTFCSQLNIKIPNLEEVTRKAGAAIISGQGQGGGWVYRFAATGGGDNSVGFWQIQALKACLHTGLWKKDAFKTVSKRAVKFLERVQGSNGAIGYRENSGQNPGLTGGGVLSLQMLGKGTSRNVRSGVNYLDANSPFKWGSANLYYHYYNAQALINYGGVSWTNYNKRFRDELLKNQNKDGTWTSGATRHGNLHMNTCLATFMLEVYYRFLPGTGAGLK